MKNRSQRGSVLTYVVVTSAVVALIAAMLVRMSLMKNTILVKQRSYQQRKAMGSGILAELQSVWNANGFAVCAGGDTTRFRQTGGSSGCNCDYRMKNSPPNPDIRVAVRSDGAGNCAVTITIPDL